jgi:hypothetical protein
VRALAGRLSALGVSHRKSILYGAFVWARRALNGRKRRFPTRAASKKAKTGIGGKDLGYEHDARRSCCRYTSDHNPINCDAARKRYTKDYLVINECATDNCEGRDGNGCGANYCSMATTGPGMSHTGAAGGGAAGTSVAYNHFRSTGEAAGYIWHSELCNADGSDILLQQECSVKKQADDSWGSGVAECGEVHGQAHIDADDGYHLFINGVAVGDGEDYTQVDAYTFDAGCDTPTVYAIDVYDSGGEGSIIADFDHCGEKIRTSTAWKCHQVRSRRLSWHHTASTQGTKDGAVFFQFGDEGAPDGWMTAEFDDSDWPEAGDAGNNGVAPWGHRVDIR